MQSSGFIRYALTAAFIWLVLGAATLQAKDNDLANSSEWKKGVLEGAILFNPHLRDARVSVAVDGNNVSLRGVVPTDTARELAGQIAAHVKGIRKVHNYLEVAPDKLKQIGAMSKALVDTRLSNVTISNKVRSQLLANRRTSGINVDIETHNRVVTMSGQVKSAEEKELAYWVVKNTQGVKQVVNRLDVDEAGNRHALITLDESNTNANQKVAQ